MSMACNASWQDMLRTLRLPMSSGWFRGACSPLAMRDGTWQPCTLAFAIDGIAAALTRSPTAAVMTGLRGMAGPIRMSILPLSPSRRQVSHQSGDPRPRSLRRTLRSHHRPLSLA